MQDGSPRVRRSPTSVPLPTSPSSGSHSEFDALIELLATDEPGSDLNVNLDLAQGNHPDLRDEDGRLDFAKIRSLFATPSNGGRDSTLLSAPVGRDMDHATVTQTNESNSEMILEPKSAAHPPWSNNVNRSTPSSPPHTSAISSLALPPAVGNASTFTAGLPPAESTPRVAIRALQGASVAGSSSIGHPWGASLDGTEAPKLKRDSPRNIQQDPQGSAPSLLVLKQALGLAHREVTDLRERCRELEELVRTKEDTALRDKAAESEGRKPLIAPSSPLAESSGHITASKSSPEPQGGLDEAQDVAALSPAQTRAALRSLLEHISLPGSCLPSLAKNDFVPAARPPSSLDDVRRALDTVAFLDELVWKRSRFGAAYDNLYGADNIEALRDRIELWEKAVRTRR